MIKNRLFVLQLSDLHILQNPDDKLLGVATDYYFNAVLKHAFTHAISYDLVLISGDLAQLPCIESYTRILKKMEQFAIFTLCLPGNHDDFSLMKKILNTSQVSCNKQTILGRWQIITLNSQIIKQDRGYLEQFELDFLETCLQKNRHLFTLIVVHHHCLPTDSMWLDTMMIENSTAFLEVVKRHSNVKIITTGHIHQEMTKVVHDITVLGTPSTCFQFTPNSSHFSLSRTPPGYRFFELFDDGSMATTVHRLDERLHELVLDTTSY